MCFGRREEGEEGKIGYYCCLRLDAFCFRRYTRFEVAEWFIYTLKGHIEM